MYLLQPSLEDVFSGRQVQLPFKPYPYQLKGIAFLMPRHAALIADEMGLGKTAQVIIALRLLFHAGLIRNALVVCPKPLVVNWGRELRLWADDLPFEVITGDAATRRFLWQQSRCPVKLVNYEVLTRDAALATDERHQDAAVAQSLVPDPVRVEAGDGVVLRGQGGAEEREGEANARHRQPMPRHDASAR